MQHPGTLRIEDFTYTLPEEKIAKYPLQERDQSKLLIYGKGSITEATYHYLADYIPSGTLLVFNQTKVVHARLVFKKDTGGIIEVFCLEPHDQYPDIQSAMLQKEKVWWKCMIGGASKWKHGLVLSQELNGCTLYAKIVEHAVGYFILELSWDDPASTFADILHIAGKVPLPPYLHREAEMSDEERYQTVYAKQEGSVAAPTAGLHFTDELINRLRDKEVRTAFVTLHVGAGTFKPVKSATMQAHDMHAEWIDVGIDLLEVLMTNYDSGIVAVGTTSLRTLESLYWIGARLLNGMVPDFNGIAVAQWDPYEYNAVLPAVPHALLAVKDWMLQQHMDRLVTRTQILIAPGYEFKLVKGLITNFHQPQSTLLLLVAALIGDDWKKVYEYALQHGFRFLSYGDGSLLWAKEA